MALKTDDLRVYYQTLKGDVKALDGASFTLEDGEIMGLAGESGCGKSTLAKSLILLKPPMKYVEGRVRLDGEELPIWDDEKMNSFRYKNVSIIPQYAMNAMNPTRKIGKMVKELLKSRGISPGEKRDELEHRLDLVDLTRDVLSMYPIELSGGMKQRMVMVISSLLDPSLLMADEITSALDVSTQKAVSEMLVEFRDKDFIKSLIFITHDISILYQIADSITVMYAGKLVERAPTEEITGRPLHPYTKLLISSLPKIGAKYTEEKLEGIPGKPPELLEPPEGCRFKNRCPKKEEECDEEPPFREVSPGHKVACWKVKKDVS
ncbi:ABC transporter ATP-binding protein [Candidatus Bipolaricaulota bacterium]|nr:ABC transporter ATP-binding protein [Candidatus Bipolaricaulota bacterium]